MGGIGKVGWTRLNNTMNKIINIRFAHSEKVK